MSKSKLLAIVSLLFAIPAGACSANVEGPSDVSPIPSLSGKAIRIIGKSYFPIFSEHFYKDGKWIASYEMLGPETYEGKWTQKGGEVCVAVLPGEWNIDITGKTVCRHIRIKDKEYNISDIRRTNSIIRVSITEM